MNGLVDWTNSSESDYASMNLYGFFMPSGLDYQEPVPVEDLRRGSGCYEFSKKL
jgi:hypothetical protein